jgi:hypothetical protein
MNRRSSFTGLQQQAAAAAAAVQQQCSSSSAAAVFNITSCADAVGSVKEHHKQAQHQHQQHQKQQCHQS